MVITQINVSQQKPQQQAEGRRRERKGWRRCVGVGGGGVQDGRILQ